MRMLQENYLKIEQSLPLEGTMEVLGAKNAVLVIMASLILTRGISLLRNVPCSTDVLLMITLLEQLGAQILFDKEKHILSVDTTTIERWQVSPAIMKKMRASILVLGPLLARLGKAQLTNPGGCPIGTRPIDYHLQSFQKMGALIESDDEYLYISANKLHAQRLALEYPSVGATENIIMAAVLTPGTTAIVNAALEPEVVDLINVLIQMGARITILPPATICIEGVKKLQSVDYTIISDRLEAGTLLLAAAITQGDVWLPTISAYLLDVFLLKLEQMGHAITRGNQGNGIRIKGTNKPQATSVKTGPYPNFPTDLQSPMTAVQLPAAGISIIEETVFENRLQHIYQLTKMGANITIEHNKAIIKCGNPLIGTHVTATDIRSSCALVLAGLIAQGQTTISGVHHWQRGYESLEKKLTQLGAPIHLIEYQPISQNEVIYGNELAI
jgi:UDP-N-acetylglucosamine 1-carboxyvinyltransferase